MWIKVIYTLGFFGTVLLVAPAFGLQCYECFGDIGTNNDCEVNLDNVVQQDCTPGFVCSVYIISDGNKSTVHRICEAENECEVIQAQSSHSLGGNKTVESCRTCNTNLCNRNAGYGPSPSMLSLILSCISFLIVNVVFNTYSSIF